MPFPNNHLEISNGKQDDYDIIIIAIMMIIKQRRFKCIKCMNKKDELYDVPTHCMKFLKYDPSWHWIEGIHHIKLEKNPIKMKVQGAPNAMNYCFTSTFGCYSKLVWGKMCLQRHRKIESIKHGLWINTTLPYDNGTNST